MGAMTPAAALTLYAIEEDLLALLDTQEMVDDPQEQLAILDEIAQKTEQAVAKRDNLIRFLRHLAFQEDNIDAELVRLKKLKASYTTGRERVEAYVLDIIHRFVEEPRKGGPRKLEGSIGVLAAVGTPAAVRIVDEALIPDDYK
ncbi:MAG: siphovirus Gp157 family protein, partial [bacterium]